MSEETADWTQRAIALLAAGEMPLTHQVLLGYLSDAEEQRPGGGVIEVTSLLAGMMNTATLMLDLLRQATGQSREQILQQVAQMAETSRDLP